MSYLQSFDPHNIETRISSEKSLWYHIDFRGPVDEGQKDRILSLLSRIPPIEADYIHLYFMCGKRQDDIAAIFQRTQADVSYRLSKGVKRLKFLLTLPDAVDEDLIRLKLSPILCNGRDKDRICHNGVMVDLDLEILVGMYKTTCQSFVARTHEITQGKVRHRFFRSMERIRCSAQHEVDPDVRRILETFEKMSRHVNILRDISYPQFFVPDCILF